MVLLPTAANSAISVISETSKILYIGKQIHKEYNCHLRYGVYVQPDLWELWPLVWQTILFTNYKARWPSGPKSKPFILSQHLCNSLISQQGKPAKQNCRGTGPCVVPCPTFPRGADWWGFSWCPPQAVSDQAFLVPISIQNTFIIQIRPFPGQRNSKGKAQDWGSRGYSSTLPQGSPTEGSGNLPRVLTTGILHNYPNRGGSILKASVWFVHIMG